MDDLAQLAGNPPPERVGFVNDFAEVIPRKLASQLEKRLADFKEHVGPEIVFATVQSTEPLKPSEYVFWLHNVWDLGGEANLGVLCLVALKERRVESEVGYGLEQIITDEHSAQVLNDVMVPYLKHNNFGEAIEQGAEALIAHLVDYARRAQQSPAELSGEDAPETPED